MSIPNYLYALANHQGPATIEAGGMRIPVKIMDLEHMGNNPYESDKTTFQCLVVNQDQIKQTNTDFGTQMADYVRRELVKACGAKPVYKPNPHKVDPMKIDRVIFNNPATIVIWADGTKTVVKCQEGDVYSKETGLALCIAKKALGNKGNFNDVFHEWIPEEKEEEAKEVVKIHIPDVNTAASDAVTEAINRMSEAANAAARALRGMAHE